MRVMVIVKATEQSEAGELPTTDELETMGRFNESLVQAGVLLAAEGLGASSLGKRVRTVDGRTTVLDGPFAETKELVAGFWIWQVSSMDEAVEWASRAPLGVDLELRKVMDIEDFGDALTPELRAQEGSQRARVEGAS